MRFVINIHKICCKKFGQAYVHNEIRFQLRDYDYALITLKSVDEAITDTYVYLRRGKNVKND